MKSLACSKPCRLGPRKTLRSGAIRLLATRSNWGGKRNQRMTPRQKNLKMRSVFTRDLNISTPYLQRARNRVFSSLKPTPRLYPMRASTSSEKARKECKSNALSRMGAIARTRKGFGDWQRSIPTRIPQLLSRKKHPPFCVYR